MRIPSGTTDRYVYFVAVDGTDFTTRETGLSTWTVYRSRNGAAAAAMTTPTINETDATNMPGVYELLCDEDTTLAAGNDTEEMAFHITHSGMAPVTRVIELYRPETTEGRTLGIESDGDLTKVDTLDGHTAQTGDSYARLGAPAGASMSADIAAVPTATENRDAITGGAYALDTDANGRVRIVDGTGAGELQTASGVVDANIVSSDTVIDATVSGTPSISAQTMTVAASDLPAGIADNEIAGRPIEFMSGNLQYYRTYILTYTATGTSMTMPAPPDGTTVPASSDTIKIG